MQGPFSLRPPTTVDDYGWLECALRIQWTPGSGEPAESLSVWVDDSVNRESDFLPPVLRLARWAAAEDYERAKAEPLRWPSAQVTLGHVRDWARLQAYAKELQQALMTPPFEPYGISAERGYPELPHAEEGGRYTVYTSNGLQSLELTTIALGGAGSRLMQVLAAGRQMLREQCEPFDHAGWVESYPVDPTQDLPEGRTFWRWEVGTQPAEDVSA